MIKNTHTSQTMDSRNGNRLLGATRMPEDDASFELLQSIVLGEYHERAAELRAQLDHLRATVARMEQEIERMNDVESLAVKIQPSLAPAISASIRDSRDGMVDALHPIIDRLISTSVRDSRERMVDALYPIIGRLVARAVSEALRDLARRIDEQMRTTLDFKRRLRRIHGRLAGVSEAELALRDAMPFQVLQIFVIHRATGLLLRVLAQDVALSTDSDIISGMLTAIRDFAEDALGRNEQDELDEVQYGGRRILIESVRYVYVAVVVQGIEQDGFRSEIRARLHEVEQMHLDVLRDYDGDASRFIHMEILLAPLLIKPATPLAQSDGVAASFRPYDPEFHLTPATRVTLCLVILVFFLALWRLWHVYNSAPFEISTVNGLALILYCAELDASCIV